MLAEAAETNSSNADQNIDPEAKDADVLEEMANSKKVMSVDQAHAEVRFDLHSCIELPLNR